MHYADKSRIKYITNENCDMKDFLCNTILYTLIYSTIFTTSYEFLNFDYNKPKYNVNTRVYILYTKSFAYIV